MCIRDSPWTDIGASRLFADYYKSVARYVPERKIWFYYEDGIWSPDTGNLKVMELCKALANNLYIYALNIKNEVQRKAYIGYANKWQARRFREIVLKDAQSVYPISIKEFNTDPLVFNCRNGTLFLKTMEFRPHNSKGLLTKISGADFMPNASCPRWNEFIDEVMSSDKEKSLFLQKSLGYGVSGNTQYECLFVLYGATTRNGKGTLCESVLKVLGTYGCTARPETISLKKNNNSASPSEDIARLAGVRFVNISEHSRGLVLNAAQVKSMTGGDTINARFLHENSFEYLPNFKLYINTNYLPVITDMTLFSGGRVKIIPFERHFEERLIQDANAEERTADLYTAYQDWCRDNGYYTENARNFKSSLASIGRIARKRPKAGGGMTTLLVGYKLLDDFSDFLS